LAVKVRNKSRELRGCYFPAGVAFVRSGRVAGLALFTALRDCGRACTGGLEIAGVIPPFGAEFGVVEVVARELKVVSRNGLPKVGKEGEEEQDE